MAEFKKALLDYQTQEKIWNLLQDEDEVIMDIMGAEVKLSKLSTFSDYDDQSEVIREIESDPELQKMLRDSELDEKAGRVYTTDEAIRFIKGHTVK
jgi:hypothetical protein